MNRSDHAHHNQDPDDYDRQLLDLAQQAWQQLQKVLAAI
jgi:hypothetical protein